MEPDSGISDKYSTPLLREKVAVPGEFAGKIESSPFANSRILKNAALLVESGQFEKAVEETEQALALRGIILEFKPKEEIRRGTSVEGGRQALILEDEYPNFHPARKLWSLIHRRMSLLLQKQNKREDPNYIKQLLNLDVAYAEAVRLGALKLSDPQDKEAALGVADDIEVMTRQKLLRFK